LLLIDELFQILFIYFQFSLKFIACPAGKWGDCTKQCQCKRGVCSPIDGSCDCTGTGYTGTTCDTRMFYFISFHLI